MGGLVGVLVGWLVVEFMTILFLTALENKCLLLQDCKRREKEKALLLRNNTLSQADGEKQ